VSLSLKTREAASAVLEVEDEVAVHVTWTFEQLERGIQLAIEQTNDHTILLADGINDMKHEGEQSTIVYYLGRVSGQNAAVKICVCS
jgi:hypothetical protein